MANTNNDKETKWWLNHDPTKFIKPSLFEPLLKNIKQHWRQKLI